MPLSNLRQRVRLVEGRDRLYRFPYRINKDAELIPLYRIGLCDLSDAERKAVLFDWSQGRCDRPSTGQSSSDATVAPTPYYRSLPAKASRERIYSPAEQCTELLQPAQQSVVHSQGR